MLKYKLGIVVGLIVVMGYFWGLYRPAQSSPSQVNWYPYKEGTDLARRQNRSMVIYFHADWCTFCGQMEKETFRDAAVVDFLNANTVAIKVDVDEEQRIARQFGVRGLPATFLLLNNGRQIGPMPGFIPPRAYLSMLSKILSSS